MDKALELIFDSLQSKETISIIFSGKKDKSQELRGVFIQPLKDQEFKVEFRLSKHNDIKTLSLSKLEEETLKFINNFKQVQIKQEKASHQILVSKKGKATVLSNKQAAKPEAKSHNREKNYLIPDGKVCDFLIEIGVMDPKGKVKSNYYKKFRQINRFLEMVDDLFKGEQLSELHAVDFGCGKSYLTFALYYYFDSIKGFTPQITGIDLKQEVIDNCNSIAQKLNYTGLKFAHGFIHDFKSEHEIDFVVTLHACDTATDDAILFSLRNNAKKMMFVPCCQHELNKQLDNKEQKTLIEAGLFRDRVCALVTDSMRAKLLESCSYKVQIMEFIETQHTAKNVLLRCQKVNRTTEQKKKLLSDYQAFAKSWNITPYLEKKLKEESFI